jgi:GT2 family glycosyltransferase
MLMTAPFDNGKNIGREYNRIMSETSEEWVGFQDHDTMFLTHCWKKQFEHAIENADNPGIISCMTNRIGCPLQRASEVDRNNHDIVYHRRIAEERYVEHGNKLIDITDSRFNPSALIFVTSKKVWSEVGGFKDGFLGVDTTYAGLVKKAGYKIYLMPGLYIYHWYRFQDEKKSNKNIKIIDRLNTAVSSDKYFITISHDTDERINLDGLENEGSKANNLQHIWFQKDYNNDDVITSINHIEKDFKEKNIIGEKENLWARRKK